MCTMLFFVKYFCNNLPLYTTSPGLPYSEETAQSRVVSIFGIQVTAMKEYDCILGYNQ